VRFGESLTPLRAPMRARYARSAATWVGVEVGAVCYAQSVFFWTCAEEFASVIGKRLEEGIRNLDIA
jgi:hypothetical protein